MTSRPPVLDPTRPPTLPLRRVLALHWHFYVCEAVELAIFMAAACGFLLRGPFQSGVHADHLRMGKIMRSDALCYVAAHFLGAVLGVAAAALVFGDALAAPGIDYAESAPAGAR